jgi:hypothetical protein
LGSVKVIKKAAVAFADTANRERMKNVACTASLLLVQLLSVCGACGGRGGVKFGTGDHGGKSN